MNNMPPSYIPPGPPPRRGPNCWLVGAFTCLGIIVLVVIAIVVGTTSFMHSATGKKFASTFGSAMHKATTDVPMCMQNMKTVRDAILRYHDHTGAYPDNLKQLVPTYLPDGSILHCSLDSNPDPSHVTFVYSKPTDSTPNSAALLTFHWQMTMTFGNQTQVQDNAYTLTKGGEMRQNTSQNPSQATGTSISFRNAPP